VGLLSAAGTCALDRILRQRRRSLPLHGWRRRLDAAQHCGLQTGLFYNIDRRPDATGSNTVGALQDTGRRRASGRSAGAGSRPKEATAGTWSTMGRPPGRSTAQAASGPRRPAPASGAPRRTPPAFRPRSRLGARRAMRAATSAPGHRPQQRRHPLRQRQPEPLAEHGHRQQLAHPVALRQYRRHRRRADQRQLRSDRRWQQGLRLDQRARRHCRRPRK
jgi:hypothetical protein